MTATIEQFKETAKILDANPCRSDRLMSGPPRIGVMLVTTKRAYRSVKDLPPQIGKAMRELATRGSAVGFLTDEQRIASSWLGVPVPPPPIAAADLAFRREADKYLFEFACAVGSHSRARNSAVHEFLHKSDCQFLIWIDDDIDADPKDGQGTLADVILRLLSHRQPIVGGLYCKRARRPQWVCTFMPAARLKDDTFSGELLQVAELGTGCKLYHRKVFTEIGRIFGDEPLKATPKKTSICYRDRDTGETVYGFFQNCVLDGDLLSEDYYLDALCRFAGICILVDTKVRLRHGTGKDVYPEGDWPPLPAEEEQVEIEVAKPATK